MTHSFIQPGRFSTGPSYDLAAALPWVLLYRADALGLADGASVSSWGSEGSESNAATPISTAPVFRPAGINGHPAVEMDSAPLRNNTGAAVTLPFTVVVLGQAALSGTTGGLVDSGNIGFRGYIGLLASTTSINNGTALSISDTKTTAVPYLYLAEFNSGSPTGKLYRNNVLRGSGATGSATTALGMTIGAKRDGNLMLVQGKVAFAGRVNRVLTSTEQTDLWDWAQARYGL